MQQTTENANEQHGLAITDSSNGEISTQISINSYTYLMD